MEQRAELVVVEGLQVQADEVTISLQARQAGGGTPSGAHGADQEDAARDDQGHEHGHRRVVEQVEVVDEEDESVVTGEVPQRRPRRVEKSSSLVVADADVVDERARQHVGQRAERDRLRRWMADRSFHPLAGSFGEAQRLLGEPGLADARRALQHDAAGPTVAIVTTELLQLGRPPGERPQRDHRTDATAWAGERRELSTSTHVGQRATRVVDERVGRLVHRTGGVERLEGLGGSGRIDGCRLLERRFRRHLFLDRLFSDSWLRDNRRGDRRSGCSKHVIAKYVVAKDVVGGGRCRRRGRFGAGRSRVERRVGGRCGRLAGAGVTHRRRGVARERRRRVAGHLEHRGRHIDPDLREHGRVHRRNEEHHPLLGSLVGGLPGSIDLRRQLLHEHLVASRCGVRETLLQLVGAQRRSRRALGDVGMGLEVVDLALDAYFMSSFDFICVSSSSTVW